MKKISWLFLSFLLVVIISCSHSTNKRTIANSSQANCVDSLRQVLSSNPFTSRQIISHDNSFKRFFNNDEDFENYRNLIISTRPSLDKYLKSQKQANNSPSVRDAVKHLKKSHDAFADNIRTAKGINPEFDIYIEETAQNVQYSEKRNLLLESVLNDSELAALLSKDLDLQDSDQVQLFERFGRSNYKGHLGEFDVLIRTENVIAQGMYLKNIEYQLPKAQQVNERLNLALRERMAAVNSNNLSQYEAKYPLIFKRTDEDSDEVVLEKASNFLKTKEFDIVSKVEGKYQIIEVKNYKKVINMSALTNSHGSKSILTQQHEMLEILSFLKIEESFFPAVAFLRGISSEAKNALESYGITIYAEVID